VHCRRRNQRDKDGGNSRGVSERGGHSDSTKRMKLQVGPLRQLVGRRGKDSPRLEGRNNDAPNWDPSTTKTRWTWSAVQDRRRCKIGIGGLICQIGLV